MSLLLTRKEALSSSACVMMERLYKIRAGKATDRKNRPEGIRAVEKQ
jgi:hypothetical protein